MVLKLLCRAPGPTEVSWMGVGGGGSLSSSFKQNTPLVSALCLGVFIIERIH